jgi:ketosteroid isomerase-like protein
MKFTLALLLVFSSSGCHDFFAPHANKEAQDRAALTQTSEAVRAAFARGDIETILSYHHPDVVKALNYSKVLNGRAALQADLTATLAQLNLRWKENRVETLWIHGDTAVEQTAFVIEASPKNGSQPSLFKGRAQIVYVRYAPSPTGWATIRELVQPQ